MLKSWILQEVLTNFLILIENFQTATPIHYGGYDSFATKFFLDVPYDNPHKRNFLEFWNFEFKG